MRYILQRLKRFCGFATGFVFLIGGIFKLLDPVGAGLVMKEYFDFLHIGCLSPAAKPLGVVLAFLECTIGAALVTGVWRKFFGQCAILLQGLFTLLTLALVLYQPQMDCGCFGEAIHLSHEETFIKNIFLCILLFIYCYPKGALGRPKKRKYVSFGVVMSMIAGFTIYSWFYIPMVDFTDFRPATALSAGNAFSAEEELYDAVFLYEKDGVTQEFGLDSLPDSTWNFISTETVLKQGKGIKEVNLSFSDSNGEYHDKLATKGKVMILSVYDPGLSKGGWARAANFIKKTENTGLTPFVLVAETPEKMISILSELDGHTAEILSQHLYYCDYKTLITMNRSNSGVTYFSEGYLIRKWGHLNRPDLKKLQEINAGDDTEVIIEYDAKGSLGFQGFLLTVLAILLLI